MVFEGADATSEVAAAEEPAESEDFSLVSAADAVEPHVVESSAFEAEDEAMPLSEPEKEMISDALAMDQDERLALAI